tara:strand:- start:281 stop:1720 length:1440 start_codon:yes stop_codon:yes gene_type:complete
MAGEKIKIDIGSDMGPGEILQYVSQLQGMKDNKQANARAERMAVLQEANIKYQNDVRDRTDNITKASSTWAGKGLNFGQLSSPNPASLSAAFGQALPSYNERWQGYKRQTSANGVENPDEGAFVDATNQSNQRYMNAVINRFNGIVATYQDQGWDNDEIYKKMQADYSADMVFKNASALGMQGNLTYETPAGDKTILQKLGITKKTMDGGAEFDAYGKTGAVVAGGTAGLIADTVQMNRLTSEQLKQVAMSQKGTGPAQYRPVYETYKVDGKNFKKGDVKLDKKGNKIVKSLKEGSGLHYKEFQKKYGMTKADFGDGTNAKAQKALRRLARPESTIAKSSAYVKSLAKNLNNSSAKELLKTSAKGAGSFAVPGLVYGLADAGVKAVTKEGTVGREVGEIGTTVAGTAASGIYEKVKKMGFRKALAKIAKQGGVGLASRVAAKGALGAAGAGFTGGASAILTLGLIGKDLVDIYNILNED